MFKNKSAWFSSCVPQTCHNFWTQEGGTIADWRTADYLFSEDATWPDTLSVFESKDYLWNKVTVFHSLFLSACEKRRSVKSLSIGHYVLPPASVQDEVRNVVGRLIWEHEDEQSVVEGSHESFSCYTEDEDSEEEISRSFCEPCDTDSANNMQEYPDSNTLTGYVSMHNLRKYSGVLRDLLPGCFQCSNSETNTTTNMH